MKTFIFCILFLVLSGPAWAQLTCTNCTVMSADGVVVGSAVAGEAPFSIPMQDNIFAGNIQLNGVCEFNITGGNYILSGQITGTGPLTYYAPDAGGEGKEAGITLTGTAANTYTGQTIISRGYLICNKTNAVAVPGNLKLSAISEGLPVHLWCLADNQFGTSSVIDFSEAQSFSFFHLNGTTQTIAGITGNNSRGVVENRENTYRPHGMTEAQFSANPAILNIAAGSTPCVFGGGGYIRKGIASSPAFTVNVISGIQVIQNPNGNINHVTFTSAAAATLEFSTTDGNSYSVGGGVAFKGEGHIIKTGTGTITTNSSTLIKPAGQIRVSGGIFRNEMGNNSYANSTESNRARLQVDANAVFDIWGNVSVFDGLTGGGVVRNNWGSSEGTLPGGGYSWLTLGQNNSQGDPVFEGVILDNSSNNQVAEGRGNGGISLKKTGTGIQVLTGANLYTGTTTVSAGTLKLMGDGRLGKMNAGTYAGIYEGVLEISNVSEAASQATFEYSGNQTQVFNGSMTNTGDGAMKGIFLQSGSGKSIINKSAINEIKTFTGHVNITHGFLGGSGDLRNATAVTVGATGSLGGGDRMATHGDTLMVSNLIFAAATSKLIVTSTASSTPGLSLVNVKTGEGADGTITAAHGFTVEVTGTNLVSGYILKCNNGIGLPVPALVLPNNSDMTGKVRLTWDSQGLWMQVRMGTLTLVSEVNKVCPGGTNPGNPAITFEATYSEAGDLPPAAAPDDYFTLSNNEAKSGSIRVHREGNKIKAEFDGANTTTADLSYTITYDDHINPAVTSEAQKINRPATLSVSAGGNSTCVGTALVLQAAGNGALTISSADTNKATVGDMSDTFSATVTTLADGSINFWAADENGCKSEYLEVVVHTLPVIGPENPSMCVGNILRLTADHEPSSTSAWAINPASTEATLEELTPADGKKVNLRAGSTAQNVTVEYTDHQGCKGTTAVAIRSILTLTHTSMSPICTGTSTNILLTSSLSNTSYTWTVSDNNVGAQGQPDPVASNSIAQILTNGGEEPVTVTYSVTGTSGTCTGNVVNIAVEVSHLQMPTGFAAGGGEFCVNPENNTYRTNLIPSVEGATHVEWTYTSYFPAGQADVISHHSQKPVKGELTVVNDELVLSGQAPAVIYYVFRPFAGCLGSPSEPVAVKLHPVPVAGALANLSICSNSAARIELSSATEKVAYTWTVDRTNSPDVSGFSEPSGDGASVSNHNPGAARTGPVEEVLFLPATALKAQTISYSFTPWHSGCPGQTVSADVAVYPRPVIMVLPPTASICDGSETAIRLSNHFGEPEKYQVSYSWVVSDNTLGAQPASANHPPFAQQTLSVNENAMEGDVTYTFTPLYTPVAEGVAISCAGKSGASFYTVVRPAVAGNIDRRPVKVCLGDEITLKAFPSGANFLWLQNGTVISGITGSSYRVPTHIESEVKYAVRIENVCGRHDSGEKEVKVTRDAYFTNAKAEGPLEGESKLPVNFTYTGPVAVYSWDFDDKTEFSTDKNPAHSYLKAATYKPTLKVAKRRQAACNKTLSLPELKIKEAPVAGDPHSSVALSVFPIPAHNRLTITHHSDLKHLTITNLRGKTVLGKAVSGREAVLSVGHLADGIYILTVTHSKGMQRLKISKN